MEHWRTVVPAGVMLEVNYEDIVNDFNPRRVASLRIAARSGTHRVWNSIEPRVRCTLLA